jgi:hypothetical protein
MRLAFIGASPHLAQHLPMGQDPSRILDQDAQQVIFRGRQRYFLTTNFYLTAGEIYF